MTPGQEAYREDLRTCPLYHDGTPRPAWSKLDAVVRMSWERNPKARGLYPATGTFYRLPDGLTWESVAASRRRWGTDPQFAPLGVGAGLIAWGTLLPCNFERVTA